MNISPKTVWVMDREYLVGLDLDFENQAEIKEFQIGLERLCQGEVLDHPVQLAAFKDMLRQLGGN